MSPRADSRGPERAAAADWLARREAGLSTEERENYLLWLSVQKNADAIAELEKAWAFLERPRQAGKADWVLHGVAEAASARARRWNAVGISVAALAAAAIAIALLPGRRPGATRAPAAETAAAGEPEIQKLNDGSVIELRSGAKVAVDYTPDRREVRLLAGEAHFMVSKDPSRPFVVGAGGVSVRAVGTVFTVRYDPSSVDVLVTEGRVAVENGGGDPGAVRSYFVDAGERTAVPVDSPLDAAAQIRSVTPGEIDRELAWRQARVEFTETSLVEALAKFNRRNRIQLALSDPSLGSIRISGIFRTDDPEGFARLLAASAGLRPVRQGADRIVLRSP